MKVNLSPKTLAVVLLFFAFVGASAADKRNRIKPATAALKIFEVWVGEWNEIASFSNGVKVKARGSNRFILGGHYLESNFTIDLAGGQKLHHMMLFGWDAQKKKYRGWMFSSSGRSLESTGVWHASKKQLVTTSAPDENGLVTKTTTQIVSRNQLRWEVVQIDKKGKVIPLVQGVDTRRKQ